MKAVATLLAGVLALALPACSLAGDHHILWTVQGKQNTVYLLGSIHVLRRDDAPLPAVAERAYADAERIVMEIDLDDPSAAASLATAEQVHEAALLPQGQTLHDVLGADYERISERCGKAGLDLRTLDPFAPWFVAITLLQLELAQRGYSPEYGIEQRVADRAEADRKPIEGLETAAQQFEMLAGMPLPVQKRFLDMTLYESAQLDQELADLLRAWNAGDAATLARLLSVEYREFPDLYRTLTVDRNKAWVERLAQLLGERDDYLVVVGAMHLVGPASVVDLLRLRGYKVAQQ